MILPVYKDQFLIDKNITFLNFGSFGACPKPIFDEYIRWQYVLENEPVRFIAHNAMPNLETSRKALGAFLNCHHDHLVYVPNPTYAVNIVAKNFPLRPGDEILSTDLEYGACDRTWNYYCRKAGATYVRQHIGIPVTSKDQIIEQFKKGYSSKTKAIFISHITSSTALRLPVEEICEWAKSIGLITIVDGAHVPAHIPLDLSTLKADIYTGACHKWMMTPKGSTFFYAKPEFQDMFDPLIISWGYEAAMPSHSQFLDYHQMTGTRDFSAYLTVPKAIEFLKDHNWTEVSAACRKMVQDNYPVICDLLGTQPLCPINDDFLGQMCSTPINCPEPEKLHQLLFNEYKIEIPVFRHGDKVFIRFSVQAFNSQQDLDYLFATLKTLKTKGMF